MKRIMYLACCVTLLVCLAAAPAFAYQTLYYPEVEVDYEDVSDHSYLEGHCYIDDLDYDGYLEEIEYVCYY